MTHTRGHVLTNTSYDLASASHEITKTNIITNYDLASASQVRSYESIDIIVRNLPRLVTVCDTEQVSAQDAA